MSFFILPTYLEEGVKESLLNNEYSKDEAREIYEDYLMKKRKLIKGYRKLVIISLTVCILPIIILSFNNSSGNRIDIDAKLFNYLFSFLYFLIPIALIYYIVIRKYVNQMEEVMKVHYSDILGEYSGK